MTHDNGVLVAALEAAGNGIVITDRQGRIEWVNPAFAEMTGYEAGEVLGQSPRLLKSGVQSPDFYEELWRTILAGHTWSGEVVNRRRDGTLYVERQTITPVKNAAGEILHFIAVKQDVTHEHRAQQELIANERYYRALIEAASDVTLVVKFDGTIAYASPSVERILGWAPGEVIGTGVCERLHPDDEPTITDLLAIASREPGFTASAESRLRHRDGSWRVFEAVGRSLPEHPAIPGVIVNARDVTERREAEQRETQLRAQLAQHEKLAAMGELLAGVAHELNNPLAVVIGYTQILKQTVTGPDTTRRIDKVGQAAERAARIVRNFLALAREHRPARERVSLNQIAREAVELLAYQLRVDDVETRLALADHLPIVWADPHQIHQVVVNLVTNAHHAMRETAPPRRLTLTSRYEPVHRRVRLEVADTGPGIPDAVRARMFEPFFTTKPVGQGTGLGLSISKGILERHGGTIAFASTPGRGATFCLELPVGAVADNAEALPTTARPFRALTILVVDDEPEVRSLVAEILANDGHAVDTAADGREALERLSRRAYDAVITDLKMPVLDGRGFYDVARRRFPHLAQRFIFLTGDTLSPATSAFLEKTSVPTLVKPFTIEETRASLLRLIEDDPAGVVAPAS